MKNVNMQAAIAALVAAVGGVLMVYMMTVKDEPGAIPLLLIVFGIGGYAVTRIRSRPSRG